MSSMIGNRALPFSVNAYSTRGGTSGKVCRSTIPCSSSARRRSDSVRGLMPASERSSSQNRDLPSARSLTSSRVHFPHTISAVMHTGHVSSTAIPTFTLPTEVRARRVVGQFEIDARGQFGVTGGGEVERPVGTSDLAPSQEGSGGHRDLLGFCAPTVQTGGLGHVDFPVACDPQ